MIEAFEAAEDSADEDTRVSRLMMEGLTIATLNVCTTVPLSLCLCNYICHAVKNKHGNSSTTLSAGVVASPVVSAAGTHGDRDKGG